MNRMPSSRILRLTALLCVAAVLFALASQHLFNMQPCAWCVLQRLILLAIAAVCIIAGLNWRAGWIARAGGALVSLLGISGILAAWYQYSVAARSFSCAQTFADRFMSGSGLDGALPWLFGIYASCMDARVHLLGIEYSLWGLMLFVLCTLLGLWVALRSTFVGSRQHRP